LNIRDQIVIVTGGGGGIGAALCRRFAKEGAAGVLVADLDAAAAGRVADEIGGVGTAVDVAREDQVRSLVALALDRYGRVDLFCSNAGIMTGAGTGQDASSGPFAGDEAWSRAWDVNVMSHVYGARAVLPTMLERGRGHLLHTVSAAGLLTDIGSAPYSTTKHAALGLAEWLAITYADRGIDVSCVCPQGVRTDMLQGAVEAGLEAHLEADAIDADAVAESVVAGLAANHFLILPHPEVAEYFRRMAEDPDRWIASMSRLRSRFYPAS
jgi:NAD(P)-dependent dehydrogenase (short-subunit alcohol dehydrogenase family)